MSDGTQGITTSLDAPDHIGAVAVVGGGIGGMQASLDLAESGFKVYLIEKESSIGGRMAQLDKTFPTNDCAMCMISPKLVDCGRHRNIEILTNADIQSVDGEPGNMKLRLLKQPRYVDEELCNACGKCEEVCPVRLPDEFNGELKQRTAIYRRYPQAIPSAYVIDKQGTSPCRLNCPAGVNVHGYVALTAQGRIEDAYRLVRARHPLPAVCGRVCHHPCEEECHRGKHDAAVGVNNIKRYVADAMLERAVSEDLRLSDYSTLDLRGDPELDPSPEAQTRQGSIAIVGGGPAGLTAAYDLAQLGYQVTLFEAGPAAGGMLAQGIPEYRLPRDILQKEIQLILDLGVELRTDCRIGRDVSLAQLQQDFDAVLLTVGLASSGRLNIENETLKGVLHGLDFLRELHLGNPATIGERVVVIGGGNSAVDAGRSALRLGAKEVKIIFREDSPLAISEEVEEATEEGISFEPLATPIEFLGNEQSGIQGVRFSRVRIEPTDDPRRPNFITLEGTEFEVPADTVIVAIGQTSDLSLVDGICELDRGRLKVDPVTLETDVPALFAAGDIATGPSFVVSAVGHGHRAALSVDRYLRGVDLTLGREEAARQAVDRPERTPKPVERQVPQSAAATDRVGDFREILHTLTEDQAAAEASRCLSCADCSECLQCVEVCDPKAINHQDTAQEMELDVGAVVLATGYDLFDATKLGEYGLGRYSKVITNLQFERMLSASGPYNGHIPIESTPGRAKKIAFIQCVGSRDLRNSSYCSGVCCMATAKEAVIAQERDPEIQSTVFYIDLRAFSKGFDQIIHRAKEEHNVRYVRSMVSQVIELPESGNLLLAYRNEEGKQQEEEFDMVVLATGMEPSAAGQTLASRLGVELDEFNFARTVSHQPMMTSRPGIFVTGTFAGPKDIPETVTQASSAAAAVQDVLAKVRHTRTAPDNYPAERNVLDEEARIGVFVCHCGSNIAGTVSSAEVADYARSLPNVVHSEDVLYACSQDNLGHVKQLVQEQGINRLLVASCTPRTHEPLFQETCKEAGLNPFLFEMADIREQVSWVHTSVPDAATEKAKRLVEMAVNKARQLKPLKKQKIEMTPSVLVIGGGLSGVSAALAAADGGFDAHLVTGEAALACNVPDSIMTEDVLQTFDDLRTRASDHPKVHVHTRAKLQEHDGFAGQFVTVLQTPQGEATIKHGTVILATEGQQVSPTTYALSDRVWTQGLLTDALCGNAGNGRYSSTSIRLPANGKTHYAMIQCVDSRCDDRPYCSRFCCDDALRNALSLLERNPDAQVTVLYQDMMSYGLLEQRYLEARDKGVRFARYPQNHMPQIEESDDPDEPIRVTYRDEVLRRDMTLSVDHVVLSTGMDPDPMNQELSNLFKVHLDENGFFHEAHVKLRPVDFASRGIFVCGSGHAPQTAPELITKAYAAAGRAGTLLSSPYLEAGGVVSVVDKDKCVACLTCIQGCPFNAVSLEGEDSATVRAAVDPAKCQGCGICAADCPAKAIQLQGFEDQQEIAMLRFLGHEQAAQLEI